MVRTSIRKRMITTLQDSIEKDIINLAVNLALDDDSSSDEETDDEDYDETLEAINDIEDKARALVAIQLQRYIAPRKPIAKAPPISDFLLHTLEDKRFKREFRMSCEHFLKLCALVSNDEVFHNDSNHPQRPVEEQMMVTLKRLGCFGNGASVGMLATFFRLGEGTVELYTNRCIMAIVDLKERYVNWPTKEERLEIEAEFDEVGFGGCVGVIDGTLMILQNRPEKDGSDYYNRKGSYGISALLICDLNKKIQYLYTGWPGCSHDQRLTSNCAIGQSPKDFFSNGQYLMADSAFSPTINMVPAFKKNRNSTLTDEQQAFNRHLSGVRVVIENCIGLLKNRFQSLKGLRLQVSDQRDLNRITAWINVCSISISQ